MGMMVQGANCKLHIEVPTGGEWHKAVKAPFPRCNQPW